MHSRVVLFYLLSALGIVFAVAYEHATIISMLATILFTSMMISTMVSTGVIPIPMALITAETSMQGMLHLITTLE